jgi:hypothetical protein
VRHHDVGHRGKLTDIPTSEITTSTPKDLDPEQPDRGMPACDINLTAVPLSTHKATSRSKVGYLDQRLQCLLDVC